MLDFIKNLTFNSVSIGVFIYFIYKCVGFKTIKIKNIVVLACLFILKTYMLDYNIPILNLLDTFLIDIYILTIAYGNLIKKLWLFIIFIALSILSEEVGLFVYEILLSKIFTINISLFISILFAKVFLLIFLSMLVMLFRVVEYENIQYRHILILLTFPLSTIILLISLRYPIYLNGQNILLILSILMLFGANVGCFYEYYMLAKNVHVKIENEIMRAQLENNGKYIALHKRKMEKDRAFMHDVKKHIAYIQSLIIQAKNKEALEYMHQYLYDIDLKRDIITGNESFDIALSLYLNQIIDHHIEIDISGIQTVDLKWIDPKDLNIIFSNLIENAVEASFNVQNPKISFSLKARDKKIIFRISNIYNINLFENERTTKFDSNLHGYGLKNVNSCLKKYGAIITSETNMPTSSYITTILFHKR